MDTLKAIRERRSIRKYKDQPVTDDQIQTILEAGMYAPSACNQQPWDFIVIKSGATMEEITTIHQYSNMLKEAGVAIVVCGNLQKQKCEGYWVQDCSAATQNMLLAAHALGLGAVWLGVHPREERVKGLQKLLSVPKHIIPFSIISIGYPDEKKHAVNRFDKACVHNEEW